MPFGVEKNKMVWLPELKVKKFDDTFSRFDRIPTCDRQTDRRMDILQQHSPRYAWHRVVKRDDR